MGIIEKLRSFNGIDDIYQDDKRFYELDGILDAYKPDGYSIEVVQTEFEEGSRWLNYKTTVYKIIENGVEAFFCLDQEVPASEVQEGMDLSFSFNEVIPKEVTVIKYVTKGAE